MPSSKDVQVGVIGLKALARDLSKLTEDNGALNKAMRQAAITAIEPVAAMARSSMSSDTTPAKRGPHLLDTIRVTGTRTGATVRMGSSTVRWAGWVEFGGTRRAPRRSSREFRPQGRYLFPAARTMAARAAELYSVALEEAIRTFPWTNQGDDPHD